MDLLNGIPSAVEYALAAGGFTFMYYDLKRKSIRRRNEQRIAEFTNRQLRPANIGFGVPLRQRFENCARELDTEVPLGSILKMRITFNGKVYHDDVPDPAITNTVVRLALKEKNHATFAIYSEDTYGKPKFREVCSRHGVTQKAMRIYLSEQEMGEDFYQNRR